MQILRARGPSKIDINDMVTQGDISANSKSKLD